MPLFLEIIYGRGHTLDPVFHEDSNNLIHSARTCHYLTSDLTAILCQLAVPKSTQTLKFQPICSISKINMGNFSVDIANGITPNMSLPDLKYHLSQVFDKQAPVCQRKFRYLYDAAKLT